MTLTIRPAHTALMAHIREAPSSPRFVVIGAVAVAHHVGLGRETGDVDLAIVAEEKEIKTLLEQASWLRETTRTQRWRHKDSDSMVDVLPATARIIKGGQVQFPGDNRILSMVGFDLALDNTVAVALDGGKQSVEVAALPALVMLKIVSWLDRPYERDRDLGDLARMLSRALDDWDERRWGELIDVNYFCMWATTTLADARQVDGSLLRRGRSRVSLVPAHAA